MARSHLFFLTCLAVAPLFAQPRAGCPPLTPYAPPGKISGQDRAFRFQDGFVAIVQELRIDSDGSPVAYHPRNSGTTHLCNGLDPYIGGQCVHDKAVKTSPCYEKVASAVKANWDRDKSPPFCVYGFFAPSTVDPATRTRVWGGVFGSGPIPRQKAAEPAPGFFVSMTALSNPAFKAQDDQRHYYDADRIPYVVVPGALVRGGQLRSGGVAWIWNPAAGREAAAVIGDTQSKFGEVSVALAQLLEKGLVDPIQPSVLSDRSPAPWPYERNASGRVKIAHNPRGPFVFVYFSKPPSGTLSNFEPETLNTAARSLLAPLGGPDNLKKCLSALGR